MRLFPTSTRVDVSGWSGGIVCGDAKVVCSSKSADLRTFDKVLLLMNIYGQIKVSLSITMRKGRGELLCS